MEDSASRIELGKETLRSFDKAIAFEWLLANGLGGYASSSVLGINTRKYHGILVAALNPPGNRHVVLSKLDEQLFVDGELFSIGSNEFNDGIYPQGFFHLEKFSRFPFPTFLYRIGKMKLSKTIMMPYQKNAVIVTYEIYPSDNMTLHIQPLINFRHFHAVTEKNKLDWSFAQQKSQHDSSIEIVNPEMALVLSATSGRYITEGRWIEGLYFRADSSEGTSCFEDCFLPGRIEVDFESNGRKQINVIATVDKNLEVARNVHRMIVDQLPKLYHQEINRLRTLLARFFNQHPSIVRRNWLKWLVIAADSFVVNRLSTKTKTVIAGYHWFEDWGRDSLICLPGLTLVTGHFSNAREILLTFQNYCKNGIIPNRFPDSSEEDPIYNTVDASLLFFNAVLQYLKYTDDFHFVQQKLWKNLKSVIDYHIQGTINNIHLDDDGLIMHGPQLTWMDAVLGDNPVTPRKGKAVEIQALWYNALKTMEILATKFQQIDLAEEYFKLAENTKENFIGKFWNHEKNCLFDVVDEDSKDASLRPNQLLSVSLDFSMLDREKQSDVVSIVQKNLWAKYGLRTLSASDPKYKGRYCGNWALRNSAYHNGTAWAWLIGPLVSAFLKVKNFDSGYRKLAFDRLLAPLFEEQILCGGLGTLNEVFDGDPPHSPGGCISQAWSVAEPLRAYVEDVLLERPKFEKNIMEVSNCTEIK